jgi:hypothetical protein
MRTNLMRESSMVDVFIELFSGSAFFVKEVPVFAKSVDLVKFDFDEQKITAIEFKKTNWKKAELQALGSALVFDFLEICIIKPSTEKCRTLIKDECTKQGIGLYFIDNETKEINHIVEPLSRNGIWEIQRIQMIEYLKGRLNDD